VVSNNASIVIGVMGLVIAATAVYGIVTVNSQISAKPEQVKVTDYSTQLDSLKSQISSINNDLSALNSLKSQVGSISSNLTALDSVKNSLTDVRAKLIDLQTKSNQDQQGSSSLALTFLLDKSTYFPGDSIQITGIGANPQKVIQVELLDGSGSVLIDKEIWADSTGKIMYNLPLSSSVLPGNYQVRLVSDKQTQSQSITIAGSSIVYTASTGAYSFTAQTDKSIYQTGDLIEISGVGNPNTAVIGVLTSPSGKTYSSATTIQPDGSYAMFFSTSQPYEIGSWYVTMNNLGQAKVLYFTIISSSTGSSTLTAYTDKAIYQKGETIQVSGIGQPYTTVIGVLTSPSGSSQTSTVRATSDGSFVIFYSTTQSYETGNWHLSLSNAGQTKMISIFLEPSSSYGSSTFTAFTDKTVYQRGDTILISGIGHSYTTVSAVLTSPSGNTYSYSANTASDGSYTMSISTSSSFETGTSFIGLSNAGQNKVISIYIGSSSGSFAFTAHTDKSVYKKGNTIQVSGIGQPSTTVSGILVSPSQNTYSSFATVMSDGTYTMFFPTYSSYETGNWYINLSDVGQSTVVYLHMEPSG